MEHAEESLEMGMVNYLADEKDYVKEVTSLCCDEKGAGIQSILRKCKSATKDWVSRKSGDVSSTIRKLESRCAEIEDAISRGVDDNKLVDDLKRCRSQLWDNLRREEREWLQKSRIKWAVAGDRNTKYFHAVASARRRANYISNINIDGVERCDPCEVKGAISKYFKRIFLKGDTLPLKQFDCVLNRLSASSAEWLERPFSEEEIWEALQTFEGSKAPGPDGFNMSFIKKFWKVLKTDFLDFFSKFHSSKIIDFSFNHSFITLIPKKLNPIFIEDFRPISLVGCVYKLLAKVLARRLGNVSENIIGDNQFAFCPGKQILDCVLIANETIDFVKRSGAQSLVFKADFQKAYGSVDWDFLVLIMRKTGFGQCWCNWIITCLSTASVSVLVNGSPTNPFAIGRGLRQGCPLSPLLFNIVAESLSALLKKAISLNMFCGVQFGQSSVEISHIQFADDLIIFCGADEAHVQNIVRILRGFEIAAGLRLNLSKSKVIGVNTDDALTDKLKTILHCQKEPLPCKYLGLPLGANKNAISAMMLFAAMNMGLFSLILIVTHFLVKGSIRIEVLGWINVAISVCVFAAPLTIMARVIRTRSVEFMPFNLSFFLTLSAVMWFSYGVFIKDLCVAVPNVVGFILGMLQMLLYAIYRNSDKVAEEKKVPEETNNSIAGLSKLGSSVHPIDIDMDTSNKTKEGDKENDQTDELDDHHKSLELSRELHLDESHV
ncbi:hypothetical protein GQ457_01G001810 [Hibiscus cannabinus]